MITIYTIQECSFCRKALTLLNERNIKYKQILVKQKDKGKFKNKMLTFPQIFYGKSPIGGFEDLQFIIDICDDLKDNNISIRIIKGICKDLN
jgi:glutaredoxin